MTLQFILQTEFVARLLVEFDSIILCYSQSLLVGREGMVGNWLVKEVMNFGLSHDDFER